MATVNQTLLISLKEDVKILNETVQNINSLENNQIDVTSWLFPNKPQQYINEFIEKNQIYAESNFKIYLELIVDRLYVGMILILNYVHDTGLLNSQKSKFLQTPKQLTVGCTFNSLWDTVFALMQKVNKRVELTVPSFKKEYEIIGKLENKKTQTDIITLNKCDSCSSAMLCMKNLLKTFENDKYENLTLRRIIRPQLYDITQFGCMLQTTTTIETSINTLFKNISEKKQENDILGLENQKLKSEIKENFGKITLLGRELDIFKNKYEKDVCKINNLIMENEDLMKAKTNIELERNLLKENIIKLNETAKYTKDVIKKLVHEKEGITKHVNVISKTQSDLTKLNLSFQKKILIIDIEHNYIKNILNNFEDTVNKINSKLCKFSKHFELICLKVEKMHQGCQEHSNFIANNNEKFKVSITKYMAEISVRAAANTLQSCQVSSFEIKGNPIEDISKQIEENEKKIKLLQEENFKLRNIVLHLK